jgi:small subunit ribosomal protein S20
MAITKSAKKAHRVSRRKRVFNLRRKKDLNEATKAMKKAIALGAAAEAWKLMPSAQKAIDKAQKRGLLKPNAAARAKSRLAAAARKLEKK